MATGLVPALWVRDQLGTLFPLSSETSLEAPLAPKGSSPSFLEAGFLGIMLFGWSRVSREARTTFPRYCVCRRRALQRCLDRRRQLLDADPGRLKIVGSKGRDTAKAVVTDFWAMVFNPSSSTGSSMSSLGCWLTGIFFVLSVSAWYYLKKQHKAFADVTMKIGLIMAAIVLLLQLISA